MFGPTLALLAFSSLPIETPAQATDQVQAVIAKMEEMGSVYLTRRPIAKTKKGERKDDPRKAVIIGVDFRPMSGSDSKKIAAIVGELAAMPHLETLLLLGMDVTDEAVEAIPVSPKLLSVQFFNTRISDKGIATLPRFQKLQRFSFTGMGLTDEGMRSLAQIKSLHTIIITDAKVSDDGVLALRSLPNLRQLTVENTAATQKSIDRLRESLPRLTNGERFLR